LNPLGAPLRLLAPR